MVTAAQIISFMNLYSDSIYSLQQTHRTYVFAVMSRCWRTEICNLVSVQAESAHFVVVLSSFSPENTLQLFLIKRSQNQIFNYHLYCSSIVIKFEDKMPNSQSNTITIKRKQAFFQTQGFMYRDNIKTTRLLSHGTGQNLNELKQHCKEQLTNERLMSSYRK